MKKYLIVLAAALVALVGCKKDKEVVISNLSFKQTELTAVVGDTIRLALVVTPAEAALPTDIVWSSSDEDVLSLVDKNGNVAIVGVGDANITAKSGEFTAVCKISADYYEAFWEPDWVYYYPTTQEYTDIEDTLDINGTKCLLKSVGIVIPNYTDFGENFPYADGGTFLEMTAIMPFKVDDKGDSIVLIDSDENGKFTRRIRFVEDETELDAWTALRGDMDPEIAGPVFQAILDESATEIDWDTYLSAISGAELKEILLEDGKAYELYIRDGFAREGYLQILVDDEGYGTVDYDFTIAWCGGYYGLAVDWDAYAAGDYANLLIQPFETSFYGYNYKTGQRGVEVNLDGNSGQGKPAKKIAKKSTKQATTSKLQGARIMDKKPVRLKFEKI